MIHLGESKSEKSCSFSAAQEPPPALDGSNINVETGQASSICLDPFGNPLLPLSMTDPLDPLNWSLSRKYTIITVVCFGYFTMIYAVTAPVPTFVDLQAQFDVSYTRINWTFAVANLGASVGPLFFSAGGDIIGRRPILILGTAISVIASGCTSIHNISIQGYSAARFFQAFGATPAITIGLAIINDLSWEYERGFRVGLWVMSLDMGAYIAPCLWLNVSAFLQVMNYTIDVDLRVQLSSFANSWFISDWVAAQGFSFTFGIQAMVAVVIMVPVLALLQIFGPRLRTLSPVVMNSTASGY
ncbi:hypothetical protein CBS147332_456 [Penicillium roqueforti]|nr:hypothetical protein CBS147332_456 [Penicillium roqueforti]KAI3120738.1 hypothetical protein CBS147331_1957 [Penicillium roqueforti]